MSNSRYRRGPTGTVAAAGAAQATATLLTAEINLVTGADGAKGVRLATPLPGGPPIVVINNEAAQNLLVYPASGGEINEVGDDTAFVLSGGQTIVLYPYTATQWYAIGAITGLSGTELGFLDGVTAGTGLASKAVVLDANGDVTMPDLGSISFGTVAKFSWDSTDANANKQLIQLPAGGGVDVPVIIIGQAIEAVDMAIHDGITEPTVCLLGTGAVATGPRWEFRKARGTATSPTVVTSADDIGQFDGYACVAAGEWVRSTQILFECTGTVATTRGPGVITFKTATDAAPSVLTTALTISAAQLVTAAAGLTVTTGIVTVSGTTETTGAGTGIVQVAGGLAADKKLATGKAAGTTGALLFTGTTSGVVTLSVADAAGTWTMKLPAAVGAAGQQLTDSAGDGICAWAAASLGAWKHDLGILDPHEALDAVVKSPTHKFTYNPAVMPEGQWAPKEQMTGIFAEEAPWAMHGERDGLRSGIAFSSVNAFGYARAAIQAIYEDLVETIKALPAEVQAKLPASIQAKLLPAA